jgi:hypothetical protein
MRLPRMTTRRWMIGGAMSDLSFRIISLATDSSKMLGPAFTGNACRFTTANHDVLKPSSAQANARRFAHSGLCGANARPARYLGEIILL